MIEVIDFYVILLIRGLYYKIFLESFTNLIQISLIHFLFMCFSKWALLLSLYLKQILQMKWIK